METKDNIRKSLELEVERAREPFINLLKHLQEQQNIIEEKAKYTKEEIKQMRTNNDSRMYKRPSDVITSYGCVWENGKYGYFTPFVPTGTGLDFAPPPLGKYNDGKGLRFAQVHRNGNDYLPFCQNNNIVLSGFGEYVLRNWGKDLTDLFEEYTGIKYNEIVDQWKKDNYPNPIDEDTELKLLSKLKEAEKNKWEKSTIHEFFTQSDNEKLNQCMDAYFKWFDELVNDIARKQYEQTNKTEQPKTINDEESEGKAQQNQFSLNAAIIERIYNFCISTKVLDRDEISNIDFINAVHSANFKELFDADGTKKSKLAYIIYVLSHHVVGRDWYYTASASIGKTTSRCSGANVADDDGSWKKEANKLKQLK